MKYSAILVLAGVLGSAPFLSPASFAAEPAAAMGELGMSQITATVKAIDHETRVVTLADDEGNEVTLLVSEEARNLPQVQVGDRVTMTYAEAVLIELKKATTAVTGVVESVGAARAHEGEMPGASISRNVTLFAVIEAIDREEPSVTLRGNNGKLVKLAVKDPSRLDAAAVGDHVRVTYSQALAISVDRVAAQ